MASIFRRGPVWWIKYHLHGQRVQQSLETPLQRVAEAKRREIEFRLSTGGMALPTETPLAPFLEEFCKHLRTLRTFKSFKNDVSCLRTFFGPVCETLKPGRPGGAGKVRPHDKAQDPLDGKHVTANRLEQITAERISQFISRRIQDDGISPKTANRLREVLHRMFAYAIKEKSYRGPDGSGRNPVTQVDRRRENAPTIRYLTLPQVAEQLRALDDHPLIHTMVAVYIYAGLRREEAVWLTREDVDLERRMLRVCAKTVAGDYWQPKTKRNRAVPISQALAEILQGYTPAHAGPWYFPSPQGKRWNPDNFSHDLRDLNTAHKFVWGCLDYRHTFGSQLAQKGESLYKIATLMGNSPDICRRHYAALIPEAMHDVVEFGARGPQSPANASAPPGPIGRIGPTETPRLRLAR